LIGTVRLERHYYHCAACGQGFCPWDTVLSLTPQALSPAAEEVVCLAGVQSPFAEASQKTLRRLAGLRLSESTVQRTTEAAGRRVLEAWQAGQTLGTATPWDWHKDAEGKTVAYVAADATGVGQQGPGGGAAEGRMANVAVIYNPVPQAREDWADPEASRRPVWQARYLASLEALAELGTPLRRQGAQIGMNEAERWIALSDGGSGLEDFLKKNFPRVEAVILDFWHAAEYVGELSQALYPQDEAAAEAWRGEWCHRLKHEGGQVVLDALAELPVRGRAARECLEKVRTYFGNQVHRMDYPSYRAKGW
jgi:hypothetical protein